MEASANFSASFELSKSATGQTIADAVEKVVSKLESMTDSSHYHQRLVSGDDGGKHYQIGRVSNYPYEDCVIRADGADINLAKEYPPGTKLQVAYFKFGGMKFAVGYPDDAPLESVNRFRDALKKNLS